MSTGLGGFLSVFWKNRENTPAAIECEIRIFNGMSRDLTNWHVKSYSHLWEITMLNAKCDRRFLIATWAAVAFVTMVNTGLPDEVLAEDISKRYGSLAELFAADAYVKAEQVPFERVSDSVVDCRFFAGQKMRQIKVTFVSQVYRGKPCPHEAIMCLPTGELCEAAKGATAILLGGNIMATKEPELDWVEHIVIELGVPCFVVMQALDAKVYGARNPGELMSFGNRTFYETGDPREAGYYALARIFSAAATVASQLPEVKATRFITTGSSKGGMAALIACGGDPRIVGSYPTAWNSGNLLEFTRLKGQRWGWNVKPKETGPAGMTATETMKTLNTPRSEEYRRLFDPHEWQDLLEGKFVMPAVGTNDPLFHLLSDQFYYDDLPCKKAFLRVPNYPHGRTSTRHADAWRFAVAAALLDRPVPTVKLESRPEGDGLAVFASISNVGTIKRLVIHSTSDPTGDYRKATWRSHEIAIPDDLSRPFRIAHVESPESGTRAAYLELIDHDELCDSIVHSNVVEIGQAVKHEMGE
jgi:hypothetical protein